MQNLLTLQIDEIVGIEFLLKYYFRISIFD